MQATLQQKSINSEVSSTEKCTITTFAEVHNTSSSMIDNTIILGIFYVYLICDTDPSVLSNPSGIQNISCLSETQW